MHSTLLEKTRFAVMIIHTCFLHIYSCNFHKYLFFPNWNHCSEIKLSYIFLFSFRVISFLIFLNVFICFYKQIRWSSKDGQLNRKGSKDARSSAHWSQVTRLANCTLILFVWLMIMMFLSQLGVPMHVHCVAVLTVEIQKVWKHFGHSISKYILMVISL